ncbi:MAG: hypothetical protein V1650_02330, partial [Candidatus Omnitrophota bacterium]
LGVSKAAAVLGLKTGAVSTHAANGVIYQQLMQQATLFSFTDAFYLSTMLLLCVIPFVFLLKNPNNLDKTIIVH